MTAHDSLWQRPRAVVGALLCALLPWATTGCATGRAEYAQLGTTQSKGIQLFDITIAGRGPYAAFIDTGVDPSVIDAAMASQLELKIDTSVTGEASGSGDGPGLAVQRAIMGVVEIGALDIGAIDALAADLTGFGKALDVQLVAILGYSLLRDWVVRIDYRTNTLAVARSARALPRLAERTRERVAMSFQPNSATDPIPVFTMAWADRSFRVSLDTGKSGGVEFFPALAQRLNIANELANATHTTTLGARGSRTVDKGLLSGLSIHSLQLGELPVTHASRGSEHGLREANAGNATFAGLVVTIDYGRRMLTFER